MTNQHPTPPQELVQQWVSEIWHEGSPVRIAASDLHVATQAAQWGWEQRNATVLAELQQARDEELDGCIDWLIQDGWFGSSNHDAICGLRAARRPKPLSLKEQALALVDNLRVCDHLAPENESILRRALEALPE